MKASVSVPEAGLDEVCLNVTQPANAYEGPSPTQITEHPLGR